MDYICLAIIYGYQIIFQVFWFVCDRCPVWLFHLHCAESPLIVHAWFYSSQTKAPDRLAFLFNIVFFVFCFFRYILQLLYARRVSVKLLLEIETPFSTISLETFSQLV